MARYKNWIHHPSANAHSRGYALFFPTTQNGVPPAFDGELMIGIGNHDYAQTTENYLFFTTRMNQNPPHAWSGIYSLVVKCTGDAVPILRDNKDIKKREDFNKEENNFIDESKTKSFVSSIFSYNSNTDQLEFDLNYAGKNGAEATANLKVYPLVSFQQGLDEVLRIVGIN